MNDVADGPFADAVLSDQHAIRLSGRCSASDVEHVAFGQSSSRVGLTDLIDRWALGDRSARRLALLAANDPADRALRSPERDGEILLRLASRETRPHVADLGVGQAAVRMIFALDRWFSVRTAAPNAIRHVLRSRPENEVVWIHTGRVVASVANHKARRNRSQVIELPRHAMRSEMPAGSCRSTRPDPPVTVTVPSAGPFPAISLRPLWNLVPEAVAQLSRRGHQFGTFLTNRSCRNSLGLTV